MPTKTVGRATRQARRQRTLGSDARCTRCGWTHVTALTKSGDAIVCYECQAAASGKRTSERHHQLGRRTDPATVGIPGNLHRDLSDRQRDWPDAVLRNPERDPLLWLAAAILGFRDHVAWWIDWLDRIAAWLCSLASVLRDHHGPRWWEMLSLSPVWEVGTS